MDGKSSPLPTHIKASFLLMATNGVKIFTNLCKAFHALHTSKVAKYILEYETCSLGNGSALIIAVREHISKVPRLLQGTLKLGELENTHLRADKEGDDIR